MPLRKTWDPLQEMLSDLSDLIGPYWGTYGIVMGILMRSFNLWLGHWQRWDPPGLESKQKKAQVESTVICKTQ